MSRIMNPREQHQDDLPMHPPVGRVMRVDTTPVVKVLEAGRRAGDEMDAETERVRALFARPVVYPERG